MIGQFLKAQGLLHLLQTGAYPSGFVRKFLMVSTSENLMK